MIRKYLVVGGCVVFTLLVEQVLFWVTLPCFSSLCVLKLKAASTALEQSYLVMTPSCTIWNVDPNNEHVNLEYHFSKGYACNKSSVPLAVIKHRNLTLQFPNSNRWIYKNCCYRQVRRAKPKENEKKNLSDWLVKKSQKCFSIPPEGVTVKSPFISFECTQMRTSSKRKFRPKFSYTGYAATVFSPHYHSSESKAKALYWDQLRKQNPPPEFPPSILMIGINGVSSLQMQRALPKTRRFALQNDFIELKGYTTTYGDDIFGNMMAMLGGMLGRKYPCWNGSLSPLDKCPFIWKSFSANNYMTAMVEDSPDLSMFNYNKLGFVNQPVDYTLRTLTVAVHTYLKKIQHNFKRHGTQCINGKSNIDTMLQYIEDFLQNVGKTYPYFLVSLFQTLTQRHKNDSNALHREDDKFLKLLKTIFLESDKNKNRTKGISYNDNENVSANNTVIILYSTHGETYKYSQESFQSSHEQALPILLVRLPASLKKKYPQWYSNLLLNSERLISAIDIHATLQQLLNLSVKPLTQKILKSNNMESDPRVKGSAYSLFQEVPLNRTCKSAKIPQVFCRCDRNPFLHDPSNKLGSSKWETTAEDYNKVMTEQKIADFQNWALNKSKGLIKQELLGYNFSTADGSLEKFVLAEGGEPIRTLIVTTWRSGSTFLGDILQSHPGTFYHFEPLIAFRLAKLLTGSESIGSDVIEQLFNCNFISLGVYVSQLRKKEWIFSYNSRLNSFCKIIPQACWNANFLQRMCSLFPFQTIKSVRLRLRDARRLLENPKLNLRIIYLVRDPRGTIQSRRKHKWCNDFEQCGNVDFLCEYLVDEYYEAKRLRKEFPGRVLVVRYEDLATHINSAVKKILKFSRMEYHHTIKLFLDIHTKMSSNITRSTYRETKSAHSTYRKTKSTPFHWMRDMAGNFTTVERIQYSCKEAMQLWGYKIAHSSSELLNRNFQPIMKPPWPEMIFTANLTR